MYNNAALDIYFDSLVSSQAGEKRAIEVSDKLHFYISWFRSSCATIDKE
jgi:hypothetical protein